MRTRWLILLVAGVVLLQLAWPHSSSVIRVVPNFFLILLVVLSVVISSRQLLWVAFSGGLVFDLYAASDFGLHMATYVLIALFLGVVWRLELSSRSWLSGLYAVALAMLVYEAIVYVPLFRPDFVTQWRQVGLRNAMQLVYNCIIVLPLLGFMQLRRRGVLSG